MITPSLIRSIQMQVVMGNYPMPISYKPKSVKKSKSEKKEELCKMNILCERSILYFSSDHVHA